MIKKILLLFILILLIPSISFAVVPTECKASLVGITTDGHMLRFKIECTGGYQAYDEDVLTLVDDYFRDKLMKAIWMIMDVTSSSVADNFTITFENAQQQTVFTKEVAANTDVTGIDLSLDWNQYLPAHEFVYLTISSDIGFGTVTIYIEGWLPKTE